MGTKKNVRSWRQVLVWVVTMALGAVAIFYPLVVYSLLTTHGNPAPGWRFAWLLVPIGISLASALRAEGHWARRVLPPFAALLLVALGLTLNSVQPLLFVPVVINTTLLLSFGGSLWNSQPLIERFARLQHPDLTPLEVRWCRLWTKIWTTFFAVNTLVATGLGLTNQLQLWAVYNGLLTYIVMGAFFVGEYSVRKYRFGRYNSHPLDRLLRWCFARSAKHQRERPLDDSAR